MSSASTPTDLGGPPTPKLSKSSSQPKGLACASCQHRKVKCDRTFPCGNCTRRSETCIPGVAVLPRQRRKRFAEKELLDRLRHYETLLRENDISFEPLHKDHPVKPAASSVTSPSSEHTSSHDVDEDIFQPRRPVFEAKTYWRILNEKKSAESDDDLLSDDSEGMPLSHNQIKDIWGEVHKRNGYLLPFGRPLEPMDLSDRHPDQITIFKLWQTYLDRVDPLLKVTHTPTLQPRIITAGSNVATIKPALNALMFSMYSMALLSVTDDECRTLFGFEKVGMLMDFQLCCSQALSNCSILCTTDREALTALYLYLLSVSKDLDPHSISSLLGIAVRIAKRLRYHMESSYRKLSALEAELRRRLWWSLVLFDTRLGEMSGNITTLVPTWDCRPPLNVNDFELQTDMQSTPKPSTIPSEAIFTVVRSEMADLMRHSTFFLDFVNPALKLISKRNARSQAPVGKEMTTHAKELESKYLALCNPENSIQYMTLWVVRCFVAKSVLMEHYSNISNDPAGQTDEQRSSASQIALTMLECDSRLMSNPLVKGFKWYMYLYMPMPAYFQVLLDLTKRPNTPYVERAWKVMSDNYDARDGFHIKSNHARMLKMFAKVAQQAWHACEAAALSQGRQLAIPRLIMRMKEQLDELAAKELPPRMADDVSKINFDEVWPSTMPATDTSLLLDQNFNDYTADLDIDMEPVQLLGINLEAVDWNKVEWNPYMNRSW